jgi:hypothetical protein
MKKLIFAILFIALVTQLHAQNLEFSVGANTGLFHYTGSGSAANSYIVGGGTTNTRNHTGDPYGNNNGPDYGAYAQLQYVSAGGFIAGSQFGYDALRSKVNITDVQINEIFFPGLAGFTTYPQDASGHTYLQQDFFNLNPYLGYRIKAGKLKIDLMPGVEFGFDINSYDKGNATYNTNGIPSNYTIDYNMGKARMDVRLKLAAAAYYHKWGIVLSYARGLTGYHTDDDDAIATSGYARSELMRVGITFRIK